MKILFAFVLLLRCFDVIVCSGKSSSGKQNSEKSEVTVFRPSDAYFGKVMRWPIDVFSLAEQEWSLLCILV